MRSILGCVLFGASIILSSVYAFRIQCNNGRVSRLSRISSDSGSRIAYKNEEDDNYFDDSFASDPYADILNLQLELNSVDAPIVKAESTIDIPANVSLLLANDEMPSFSSENGGFSMVRRRRSNKQPRWFQQFQNEYGPWDAELGEDDEWLQECRNLVEENSGLAIWSQRSSDELRRARRAAPKEMEIPSSVKLVVNAVYIDRSHKMHQLKQEQEFAVREYRKWLSAKRKEMGKKDPLPIVKGILTERWLQRHPNTYTNVFETVGLGGKKRYTFSKYTAPVGVLDEITDIIPVRKSGSKSSSSSSAVANGAVSPSQGTPKSALNIPSVLNWDKKPHELLDSTTNPSSPDAAAASVAASGVTDTTTAAAAETAAETGSGETLPAPPTQALFKIDDEEMFVANSNVGGYFVVL